MATPSIIRRRRLAIAALLAAAAAPVAAQYPSQYPSGAVVQPLTPVNDPGQRLAAALRTLSINSSDITALREAGRNSLLLGDASAAAGFFARADQINPRDGRVKAGLAAALVQLERPADALPLFAQAAALGVPPSEFASDRGLAYDLSGEPQAAQRDYRAALAAKPDDDVARRRLALSQGIAGDRRGAIETLDPLIRRSDIAAWRAQTFVLAMTGDAQGANAITRVMLPQQQAALQPFLVRLSALTPAQKARAVHFGEMPGAGIAPIQTAAASPSTVPPRPSDLAPIRSGSVASAPVFAARASVPVRQIPPRPAPLVAVATPAPTYVASPVTSPPAPAAATTTPAPLPLAALAPDRDRADLTTAFRDPIVRRSSIATANTVAPTRQPMPAPSPAPVAPTPVTVAPAVATTELPPSAVASASSTPIAPALPQGATGGVGHYDLPHVVARPAAHVAPPAPRITPPRPVETARAAPVISRTRAKSAPADDIDAAAPSTAHGKSHPRDEADGLRTTTHSSKSPRAAEEVPVGKGRRHADDLDMTEPVTKHGKSVGASKAASDDADEDRGAGKKGGHGKSDRATDERAEDARTSGSHDRKARDKADRGRADDDGDRTAKKDESKPAKNAKGSAERVYVQVAGGANRDDLGKAWAGVRKQAPDLMKGRSPSTTPLKATNRLLVGPFKDEDEAQGFVNKMAGKGVSGFVFKSAKGQKVDEIDDGK